MVGDFPSTKAASLMVGDFPSTKATSLMTGVFPPTALIQPNELFKHGLPEVGKDAMAPGDVLVWAPHPADAPEEPKPAKLHDAIAKAQGVLHTAVPTSFAGGEVTAGHAAMWIKPTGAQDGPEVGEAGGQGVKTMDLKPGHWVAYRSQDAALGQLAADTARTWAEGGQLVYSKPRAVAVLPRTLMFGTGSAEELAASRHQARTDAQTPTPSFAGAGTFCSEFAASAYHSAAAVMDREPVLDIVPSRTSPSSLHAALERSENFEPIGIIRIDPKPAAESDSNVPQGTGN